MERLDLDGNLFYTDGVLTIAQGLVDNFSVKKIMLAFSNEDQNLILPLLMKSDVLLSCVVCGREILPLARLHLWNRVRRDCLAYHQLFRRQISDCGADTWRFTRALFRARKDMEEEIEFD